MSCDYSHMSLHHPNRIKRKEKLKEKQRNIKSRKIDKKRKILVSKYIITR